MTLLLLLIVLAVLGLAAAVVAGVITGGIGQPAESIPAVGLPDGPVSAGDLGGLRFTPALRGYRMDQVDSVLDRLGQELARRDNELARLRDQGGEPAEPAQPDTLPALDPPDPPDPPEPRTEAAPEPAELGGLSESEPAPEGAPSTPGSAT